MTGTLAAIASDAVLDGAYSWLCHRRRNYPADADVCSFRRDWPVQEGRIQIELSAGRFRLGLLDRITLANGDEIDLWSARDALVLKALAMVLPGCLPVSPRWTHVRGNGGSKAAVRQVWARLGDNRFVFRTDVKSYYVSIEHVLLLDRLAGHVKERSVLSLIGQYLRRTAERGGQFFDYERGISLGCPLSPLIGAFSLDELERRMERLGLFYVRFMDDLLVLAPTRWTLRRAVKAVNEGLASLGLEKHPDKTFIGRIERSFGFLGYHFSREGLTVAAATLSKFVERASRLNEQEHGDPTGSGALGQYARRWGIWVRSGLGPVDLDTTATQTGLSGRSKPRHLAAALRTTMPLPPRPRGRPGKDRP